MGCALLAVWSCGLDDSGVVALGDGDASTTDGSSFDASSDVVAITDSATGDSAVTDSGAPDTGPCVGTLPTCDTTACASANEVCTPPIPTGWHVTNLISAPQACDVAYGGDAGGSSVVEITDGGPASCACDCEAAGSPSCANAHVDLAIGNDNTCSAATQPLNMTNGCSGLSLTITANSEATVSISPTATCTGTVTPTIPTIDGGLATTCDLNADAGAICAEHRECVPKPSSGRICIAQAAPTDGGALACPSGFSYSLQTTVASSFSDTRNCSACSCGFIGTGCVAPSVSFNSAVGCSGTETPITQGSCANNGGGLAVGVTGTNTPPTCTQNDGGILDGGTTIVAPETVCCAD